MLHLIGVTKWRRGKNQITYLDFPALESSSMRLSGTCHADLSHQAALIELELLEVATLLPRKGPESVLYNFIRLYL